MNRRLSASLAVMAAVAAAGSAAAQGASSAALGGPAQARVAAPAAPPRVKPGAGGGPQAWPANDGGQAQNINNIPMDVLATVEVLRTGRLGSQPCEPNTSARDAAEAARALTAGDWCRAAVTGASSAQIVRAAQAKGELPGVDPDTAVIHLTPGGPVVSVYAMKPLPSLEGVLPPGVVVRDYVPPGPVGGGCFGNCGTTTVYPSGPGYVANSND